MSDNIERIFFHLWKIDIFFQILCQGLQISRALFEKKDFFFLVINLKFAIIYKRKLFW